MMDYTLTVSISVTVHVISLRKCVKLSTECLCLIQMHQLSFSLSTPTVSGKLL